MRALLLVALLACEKRDQDGSLAELLQTVPDDGPGVQLVIEHRGARIFEGSRGLADLENAVPVTQDTVFGI